MSLFPVPMLSEGLRRAVVTRDWDRVRRIFAELDVPEKIQMAQIIVGDDDRDDDRDGGLPIRAAEGEPQLSSTLAAVYRAQRLVEIGWGVRTGEWGRNVGRDQAKVLHEYLCRAERLLIELTARDPGLLEAWRYRLVTAKGLGLGIAEARRRYNCLAKYHPYDIDAQRRLLQHLCPKWGGSWDAAFGFARECLTGAPPGAPNAIVLILAYFEQWSLLPAGEGDVYFRKPEIRQDLLGAANRSVLHPDSVPGGETADAHAGFALAFSMMGEPGLAWPHFEAITDVCPGGMPWCFLPFRQKRFDEYRAAALNARFTTWGGTGRP